MDALDLSQKRNEKYIVSPTHHTKRRPAEKASQVQLRSLQSDITAEKQCRNWLQRPK